MSKSFEQGKDEVVRLCRYFATNAQAFLAPGVKEAHVRQSLIDPFFEALGWDVRNTAMAAPQYREVIPEDSLDVEGHQKAPDYTFRVGPLPKFYAEAKKCGVNINADPGPAYQLRRYGWSAKVAVSILTDFQELGVYDCTSRPHPSDKASHARIQYFHFEEYPGRWRELWDVFSREAVWSGAFDQYTASKRKRGTSEVDVEFLKEIEGWRDALARNIALRNKNLSPDDLNTAVQMTIDRVVFLRMAEDRGIEPFEQLLKLCERPDVYPRFIRDLCRRADEKYNSGLFHFKKETDIDEAPDLITPRLTIDDKVFKPILQSLYFTYGSPYHFGVLPVEILGTVYERFLGKVIRLTAGHQAKIEEKPEVRKAGGVYYTPSYIVDYIVKNTVGKQIEGKSPAQLAGGKGKPPFRVLDMACGSGSFLLGAYQCLLDHCLKWYIEHKPAAHKQAVFQDARRGEWRLSIQEKKRILTTHIFGVDIDPQAVEVSKLSLLLKALEGEDDASLSRQLALFHDRALPNLSDNIKCGNSLIGPDYFTGKLLPDTAEIKRVNPFDWKQGFPYAMNAGGFDCVIGNPPYGQLFSGEEREHIGRKLRLFGEIPDAYVAFLEQAQMLLADHGRFGYIIPSAWLGGPAYREFRKYVLEHTIETVISLPFDVFPDAYIDTVLITTLKSKPRARNFVIAFEYPKKERISSIETDRLPVSKVAQDSWRDGIDQKFVMNADVLSLLNRLNCTCPRRLTDYFEMKRGVLFDRELLTKTKTSEQAHQYFEGDVYRYSINYKAPCWVEYGSRMREYPRDFRWFERERILLRRLVNRRRRLMASLIDRRVITNKNLYTLLARDDINPRYLLSILNSRLISRLYLSQVSQATKDDFPQVTIKDILALPCPALEFSDLSFKSLHDRIVSLVDSMLTLHKQLAAAKSEAQKGIIHRQIDATDREIDRLVYELYGLTEEEIAIVEEGVK